ncbi:uncharacterized protein LOC144513617 [Sander vitreus]
MKPPAVFPVVGVTYQHAPPTLMEVPPTPPEAPPTLLEAPSGVIVEVKDTKTNSSLSFTIFILAEDETAASGSSSESSEESQMHKVQQMALLPQTEPETSSRPIRREYEEENVSSEEMMSDQPMLVTLSEDFESLFLNTTESSVSPMFSDDFNNSTESSDVIGYFNDKNNFRSEHFTNDSNSKETSDPLSDDFNNSTESAELTDQPARNVYPPVSQSSSSGKTSYGEVASSGQSISEDHRFGFTLGEVFRLIQKVVDLLSVDRAVTGSKGSHRKVVSSTPTSLTDKKTGFTLSSDESDESSESVNFDRVSTDPKNQTRVPDSDESLEATSSSFQQGTGPRDSTRQLTGSTTNSHSDLSSPDPDRKQVQDASVKSIKVENGASLNPVSVNQDVESMFLSMPQDTVSKESSRSFSRVNVSLNSDSSEESQEVTVSTTSLISDLSSPDTSVKSIQVDLGVSLNPVSPYKDVASQIFSTPRDTVSKESSRSFFQVNVSLNSDSSEESQEVVGLTASVPGLSRVGTPDVSSSSEEVLLVLSSPKTPTESGHFTSESEDSSGNPGLDSDSGNDSQSTELHLYPVPTSDSKLSLQFKFNFSSEISREQSEESLNIRVPTAARTESGGFRSDLEDMSDSGSTSDSPGNNSQSAELHLDPVPTSDSSRSPESNFNFSSASSEANMDTKPDSLVKESAADLSLKATSDSSNDVSVDAEPPTSLPSVYVSSGASHGANADAGSESSVEKQENAASTEATADSGKPTEYPAGTGAIVDANANVEREKAVSDVSTDAKPDVRKRPLPRRPRRKRPFRFGFLGPISHSHGNQPVAVETASKETSETLALKHRQNVYRNLLDDLSNDSVARDGVARVGAARDGAARVGAARVGAARVGVARVGAARVGVARVSVARVSVAVAQSSSEG